MGQSSVAGGYLPFFIVLIEVISACREVLAKGGLYCRRGTPLRRDEEADAAAKLLAGARGVSDRLCVFLNTAARGSSSVDGRLLAVAMRVAAGTSWWQEDRPPQLYTCEIARPIGVLMRAACQKERSRRQARTRLLASFISPFVSAMRRRTRALLLRLGRPFRPCSFIFS